MHQVCLIALMGCAFIGCRSEVGTSQGSSAPPDFSQVYAAAKMAIVTIIPKAPDAAEEQALGTGFLVAPGNLVVTAEHVVRGFAGLQASLPSGRRAPLAPVASDQGCDLAVLEISDDVRQPNAVLELDSKYPLRIGEWVSTIGTPYGLQRSLSVGIVSGLERGPREARMAMAGLDDGARFIQIDAVLYPGNSGGPLLNGSGHVVGVVVASYGETGRVGFAVPAANIRALIARRTAHR